MAGHNKSMSAQVDDFRAMFHANHPKVAAYARRRADDAVADDVVAETFLVAWRRRTELSTMDNPLPWLYAVAGNQLRNQQRSATRHLRLVSKMAGHATAGTDPADPAAGGRAPFETDPAVDVVRSALGALSFDDQEVLRLIAWEELTYQETAAVLGCSVDAVAQRIRRAKQRLARSIADLTDTDPTANNPDAHTHTRGA